MGSNFLRPDGGGIRELAMGSNFLRPDGGGPGEFLAETTRDRLVRILLRPPHPAAGILLGHRSISSIVVTIALRRATHAGNLSNFEWKSLRWPSIWSVVAVD